MYCVVAYSIVCYNSYEWVTPATFYCIAYSIETTGFSTIIQQPPQTVSWGGECRGMACLVLYGVTDNIRSLKITIAE